ncbi:MAG TPA: hypothetical protein VNK49_12925 [Anaerolineales bacterium]|nr:hypothetical protein [Anaerolineales bacterium]
MLKEDDLRETLNETAKQITSLDDNPRTWLSWMVYLLARLEERATLGGPANRDSYLEMLSALQDEIRNRIRTGGWN